MRRTGALLGASACYGLPWFYLLFGCLRMTQFTLRAKVCCLELYAKRPSRRVAHKVGAGLLDDGITTHTQCSVLLLLHLMCAPGIDVCLEAPLIRDAAAWQAAFITSTSRMVMPVGSLFVPRRLLQRLPASARPDTTSDKATQSCVVSVVGDGDESPMASSGSGSSGSGVAADLLQGVLITLPPPSECQALQKLVDSVQRGMLEHSSVV